MAVTIVETRAETRAITGGVDTHADVHVAAALDPIGGLLGVEEFPASPAGYARLLGWLGGFGTVCLVGIEGTGSYGAGLSRHVTARHPGRRGRPLRPPGPPPAGQVRPAGRGQRRPVRPGPRRAEGPGRRRGGDPRADDRQAGRQPERTRTINQARALILTGPDDLRARFARHTTAALVAGIASLRPRPGDVPGYATRVALRELGRRAEFLDGQLERLDELIAPSSPPAPQAFWPCTGSAPHRRAAAHRGGRPSRTAAVRGRLGAPVRGRPDPRIVGKVTRHGSTPAETARPTTPCGGSYSPGWARTQPPAPTSSGARRKGNPRQRSSAA